MATPLMMERPESAPLAPELQEAEMADEELFTEMAPKGQFTPSGLNALVKATNSLLPAFEQTGDYPSFESEATELPSDFVRVLSMFAQAVADAIAEDVLDPEMALSMEGIINDTGLRQLAGRIDMLSKSKEFKRWLSEEMEEEAEEMAPEAQEEAELPIDEDELFLKRM